MKEYKQKGNKIELVRTHSQEKTKPQWLEELTEKKKNLEETLSQVKEELRDVNAEIKSLENM